VENLEKGEEIKKGKVVNINFIRIIYGLSRTTATRTIPN
jgi:hypothetical protein